MIQVEGEKLRSLRLRRGWTQRELARRMGVAEKTVANLEQGRPAHVSTVGRAALALECKPEDLLYAPEAGPAVGLAGPGLRAWTVRAPSHFSDEQVRRHLAVLKDLGYQVEPADTSPAQLLPPST